MRGGLVCILFFLAEGQLIALKPASDTEVKELVPVLQEFKEIQKSLEAAEFDLQRAQRDLRLNPADEFSRRQLEESARIFPKSKGLGICAGDGRFVLR